MASTNPFDAFGDPSEVSASEGLQPAPPPSLVESFKQNFIPLVGSFSSKLRTLADQRTVRRAETQGVAQPGDDPIFGGKVSQAEADAARQRYSKAQQEREAYESFSSPTWGGKAVGLVGGLAGGIADPVNALGVGGVVARGFTAGAGFFGVGQGMVTRMLATGVEAGAVNAAIDIAGQGLDIASELQKGGYSATQTGAAFGIGAGFGFGLHGVAEVVSRRVAARQMPDVPQEPAPPAVRPAEAEPVRVDAASDAVQDATAASAVRIPDETLKKVVDSVDQATPVTEHPDRVAIPLSQEEAAALRLAGVDVDDAGTMPSAAADALRQEQGVRAAAEVAAKAGDNTAGGSPRPDAAEGPSGLTSKADGSTPAPEDIAQPMAIRQDMAARSSDDARFPARRELAGESSKPRELPANATPEEIAAFRVTDAMRSIIERLGRKLEVDRRFTAKGALGEYKPGSGVVRLRQEGDFEVFAHEIGHAIDQRLRGDKTLGKEWAAVQKTFADEVRAMDANATDPSKRTVAEGTAEFLRTFVTNPAYARKQAPRFAAEFDRILQARPELSQILADAARISQIDSGMAPADVLRSMITTGIKPEGVAKFNQERRREGLVPTLSLWFDRFYANLFGKDHWIKRFTDQLREAQFQKTGKPLPEFGWTDPYKSFRMLPGAKQAAVDGLYYGVRGYGRALDGSESPALYDALAKAYGSVTKVNDPDDPAVRSFSAYLIARRSEALYDRWKNGDLKNPPVRASLNEVRGAIAELEAQFPAFRDAANDVFDFSAAMLRKKFEAGLLSRETYDALSGRGEPYVPFYRDFRDTRASGGARGGAAGQEGSVVKTLKGSTRDIVDPIHSLVFDTAQTERIIALNDSIKALHALAKNGGEFSGRFLEQVPSTEMRATSVDLAEGLRNAAKRAGVEKADAEIIIRHMEEMVGDDLSATVFRSTETTARGERLMFYWDAGERIALKVGDNEYAKNFYDVMSMMAAPERDIMFGLLAKGNALFSQLITNAPQFALKNLVMDNLSRIFVARHTGLAGRVPGASIVTGVYAAIFDREFAKAYAAMGGIRGGVASSVIRELDEAKGIGAMAMRPHSAEEMRALAGNPTDLVFQVVKRPDKAALNALELVVKGIEATETLGRLGQAKIVYRHLRKQGLSKEDAFGGAIYEARDVLDYDRRGWAVAGAARFLPFYNAGLQGIDRSGRALFGAPIQAAIQSMQRGGYQNLDEAAKTALADAVKNWGMIAAGVVATLGYAAVMSDSSVYQRMSEYMRRRYYIFPAGTDETGKTNVVTLPKPFDHAGGIFAAVEAAMYGLRRSDPETWSKVVKNLKEGFIPRQISGIEEFLGSLPPTIKVPFEVLTGQKMPFDGGKSFPIVPQNLRSLPPEMQYTGTTSWLARKMGSWFGVSPVVSEHVLYGMGATTVRDVNNLLTAVVDDQPNVTVKDAMTRMFFGGLYREQRGGGAMRSEIMELMGRENGKYSEAAAGYRRALESGDNETASNIYNRGNDLAKTLMSLRAGRFSPEQRQLHPLERTASIGDVMAAVSRDLANSRVEILDRSRKKGEQRQFITLQPTTARSIANTIGSLMSEEIRNGLSVAGQPGYENFDLIDTKGRYAAIRALSPEVADELERRIGKAHVLPIDDVKKAWPTLKDRLLKDRQLADLADLRAPRSRSRR